MEIKILFLKFAVVKVTHWSKLTGLSSRGLENRMSSHIKIN